MALAGKNLELAMRIRADLQQAIGELKQLEGAVEANGRQAESSSRDMEKLGKTIGNVVAAFAGGAVYKAVISATIEQERVTAQLEQTLRSTQGAAGLTRDELLEMASAMQQVTTYGDEAVIPAQSLLLTFTKIGREVFPRALETVLDMSTAMGQDLKSSAIQLGKALNDPIQGVAALSRVGVQFTEQQKEQIKTLVESGRIVDAQKMILAELETQMGGSARAARETLGGSIQALKNAFGDLLEAKGGLKETAGEIEKLTQVLSDPATAQGVDSLVSSLVRLTGTLAAAAAEGGNFLAFLNRLGVDVADSNVDGLQQRLDDLRGLLADDSLFNLGERLRFFGDDGLVSFVSDDEIRAEIKRIEDVLRNAPAKPTVEIPVTTETEEVKAANKEYDKLLTNLQKQSELFGVTSEAARVRYAIERGELGELDAAQQQALLRYAQEIDAKRASGEASKAAAQASEQQTRQQEQYVRGLERSAALIGLSTDQVRAYELAEKGLTGALRDRAIAAQAVIAAEERKQQLDADAKQIAGLRAQLLRAEGRDAEALTIEIEQRYGELMTRLRERGDTAGLAIIDGLVNVEQAQIRFNEIQRRYDDVLAEQTRQEQSVQAEQQAGLLSEVGARERILEIHRQTNAQLQEIRPLLAEMAQMPGAIGASAQLALDNLDAQANRLRATTSLLQETLRNGIEGGLTSALTGLANGTMNLREAVIALGQSVADALAQMAAKNLAEGLTNSVMGMFGSGADAAAETAAATATATAITTASTAGATAMGTGITAGGTTAATAMGAAITSAGASAAAAMASSIAAASAASSTSNALSSAASVAAVAASTGGHITGPGTTTSDSIPAWLSNYEFVTRAAVVQQPGALSFLHDFNARGMAAVNDYRVRHSTGGIAGVPAPALPSPGLANTRLAEPAKSMSTTLKNAVNLYAVQRPEDIAAMAWGDAGRQHFAVYLQQNGAEVRQILGIS